MLYCAMLSGNPLLRNEPLSELSDELERYKREHNISWRELEELADVSKTALHDLIHPDPKRRPRISTFIGVAKALELPLWKVIQMAGYDPGLSDTTEDQARQLVSLAEHQADVQQLLDLLLKADSKDRRAVLNFLSVRGVPEDSDDRSGAP